MINRAAAMPVIKLKKCKVCGLEFKPTRPLQPTCSFDCSIVYGLKMLAKNKEAAAKREAKEHRERKAKAKTRQEWLKDAQTAFNLFIRTRDKGRPCISCGRHHQGQYHAGHYRSTKAAPELRFEELNVWKQCQPCNTHLSGNIIEYRKRLIARIGVDRVEWLEGKHEAKHYTIDDLKAIKSEYTKKAKELE